ncbi:MAG: ATP-binding protein [Blautia sp.]|nr:ATP-binding protein [Blautia sp.]MCM1200760.1 ATP-binding protein [Bacteroides fragilis]
MVRIDDRLEKIKRLYIDRGKYFIINRGRQYGKTTTLMALAEYLKADYVVIPMDFQMLSTANFANEQIFASKFIGLIERYFSRKWERMKEIDAEAFQTLISLKSEEGLSMDMLFRGLSSLCETAEKPVVMMIDEVDSASNNRVFLDFLAQLRGYYLNREEFPIFRAVVLAGVYDIKNLKLKIRPEEEHQYNSPWNIAADFTIDMDFSADQIADMLYGYEEDHNTGMDIKEVAKEIYQYTFCYPYLVSAICKIVDERLCRGDKSAESVKTWTGHEVTEAVKMMLKENIPLFDSMIRQLDRYKQLRNVIERILFQGKMTPFSPAEKYMNLGRMFGFLKEKNGYIVVANRIFEMYLLDLLIAEESIGSDMFSFGQSSKNQFVKGRRLDMKLALEKFVEHFTDIYGDNDEKFVETYGRKFFLLYLKPIINGTGNYYVEAQTRDAKRTDVIVDYFGERFIVGLKIWHGSEYHERGEKQLVEYLDYYHQDKGYLLSFNFNKKKKKGLKELRIGDKTIVEAIV